VLPALSVPTDKRMTGLACPANHPRLFPIEDSSLFLQGRSRPCSPPQHLATNVFAAPALHLQIQQAQQQAHAPLVHLISPRARWGTRIARRRACAHQVKYALQLRQRQPTQCALRARNHWPSKTGQATTMCACLVSWGVLHLSTLPTALQQPVLFANLA
jgi:hypothetical protein